MRYRDVGRHNENSYIRASQSTIFDMDNNLCAALKVWIVTFVFKCKTDKTTEHDFIAERWSKL